MPRPFRRAGLGAVLALPLLLAACGGGSSQYNGSLLDGQVLMSAGVPVYDNGNGNVCVYALVNGQGNPLNTTVVPWSNTGTLLTNGCVPTDANGHFSIDLSSFYGPVLIQVSAGSYANIATGPNTPLPNVSTTNASLQAIANIGGGGTVNAVITPLTTIATVKSQALAGGLNAANYATASADVAAQFQLGSLGINAAPQSGDAYDQALRAVQQYLVNGPGSSDDPNGNSLLTWNAAALPTVQSDYTSAYTQLYGSSPAFSFH
jgi:hypothetical protein